MSNCKNIATICKEKFGKDKATIKSLLSNVEGLESYLGETIFKLDIKKVEAASLNNTLTNYASENEALKRHALEASETPVNKVSEYLISALDQLKGFQDTMVNACKEAKALQAVEIDSCKEAAINEADVLASINEIDFDATLVDTSHCTGQDAQALIVSLGCTA